MKIKVFKKSILFCKYLRNGSSDLHEILYGAQLLSCDLMYQISFSLVHKCARTSCKSARSRFIAIARIYNSYMRIYNSYASIYARIRMKFDTYNHKIVIDHHIKFHEDPSFRCGNICKTIFNVFFIFLQICNSETFKAG